MARARNIKPALFKNELLGVADPLLTLLFESLWCLADREGRLEDRPLRIKAETFPYRDGIDMNAFLSQLQEMGFILRYTAGGMALIQIINFKKHQTPHNTEKPSELPAPLTEGLSLTNAEITQAKRSDSLLPPTDTGLPPTEDAPQAASAAPKKSRAPAKTPLPNDFGISERVRQWAAEKGFNRLEAHFENFVSACRAKGYTYADWDEGFMGAIRNDWAKLNQAQQARASPQGYESAKDRSRREAAEKLTGRRPNDQRSELIDIN